MQRIPITPGIYPDVSFEEYCRWDAINRSTMQQISKSPAHYYASREGLLHYDSEALTFGRLAHAGKLEPLTIPQRYAVMPDFHKDEQNVTASGARSTSKGTTYYKNKAAAFEQANEDKEIVSQDFYNEMCRLLIAIDQSPTAKALFDEPGRTELSICWEDKTGLLCKCRIDKELAIRGGQVDLKTTADCGDFDWSIWKYQYHVQAAFYREGWAAATGEAPAPFWLSAVGPRDSDLCTCLAAPVSDDLLQLGSAEVRTLMADIEYYTERDEWPNYEEPNEWTGPKHKVEAELDRQEEASLTGGIEI